MRRFTTSKGRLEKDLVEILEVYLTKIINVLADISFLQPCTKQCNTIQGLQVGNQASLKSGFILFDNKIKQRFLAAFGFLNDFPPLLLL